MRFAEQMLSFVVRDEEHRESILGDLREEHARHARRVGIERATRWHLRQSVGIAFRYGIVKLLRRKAECYGWATGGEPWDALAEDYEPGCTAKGVDAVFTPLRDRLTKFLAELMDSPNKPRNIFAELEIPIEQQQKFVRFVAEAIGFDFSRGRLECEAMVGVIPVGFVN